MDFIQPRSEFGHLLSPLRQRRATKIYYGVNHVSKPAIYCLAFTSVKRFLNKIATVIGPIPPGTGVKNEHFEAQLGSASPIIFPPSSLVPASNTIAPSLIISGIKSPGEPAPRTIILALFVYGNWELLLMKKMLGKNICLPRELKLTKENI